MSEHTFPLDWNAWIEEWQTWKEKHRSELRPTSWKFPGKNFLADEIIGTYSIRGRNVELSEVRFPVFGERPPREARYIGVTFGTGAESDGGGVVSSFAELEELLGLDN